jgi:hypothetical protein
MDSGEDRGLGGCHKRIGHGSGTISAGSLVCRTSKGSFCNVSPRDPASSSRTPALFGNKLADNIPGQLACLPVMKAELAISTAMVSVDSNWIASTVICGHLIVVIQGKEEFGSADHSTMMVAGKA